MASRDEIVPPDLSSSLDPERDLAGSSLLNTHSMVSLYTARDLHTILLSHISHKKVVLGTC